MNWMENCSFVGHYIFMKMWWKCVHVFDTCFLAHFIWKFPPPKINSEGSVLVTVMSSVLVYLGLLTSSFLKCHFPRNTLWGRVCTHAQWRNFLPKEAKAKNQSPPLSITTTRLVPCRKETFSAPEGREGAMFVAVILAQHKKCMYGNLQYFLGIVSWMSCSRSYLFMGRESTCWSMHNACMRTSLCASSRCPKTPWSWTPSLLTQSPQHCSTTTHTFH